MRGRRWPIVDAGGAACQVSASGRIEVCVRLRGERLVRSLPAIDLVVAIPRGLLPLAYRRDRLTTWGSRPTLKRLVGIGLREIIEALDARCPQ